jgi:hypothetical protein
LTARGLIRFASPTVHIAVSQASFAARSTTLPFGPIGYEAQTQRENGERMRWSRKRPD